jgi:tRNA dimethylallyltransferase
MKNTPDINEIKRQNGSTKCLPTLLLIAGPTASGKSGLAVIAAKMLAAKGGEAVIINADASQVYADLNIISARPTMSEMQNIPHKLYGYRQAMDACSAADWAEDCKKEIDIAIAAGKSPILVGGSGMYISTLLDGIAPIPDIDKDIRRRVRDMPQAKAYAALQKHDPDMAQQLNHNDRSRVQRALEVILHSGKSIKLWRSQRVGGIANEFDIRPIILLPEREWLYARCDQRFVHMAEHGGLVEIEQLLMRKLPGDLPIMRAIGVREIGDYLKGDISYQDMIAKGQMATRRYAKRQYTWLRNQPPDNWPHIMNHKGEWEPKQMFADWLNAYN